ncbi:MAG: putative ABC transporter permease [Lachnospiraceae bacterium]|nr:putative ABC transporter permease [Lachnospiraceae bacterium]
MTRIIQKIDMMQIRFSSQKNEVYEKLAYAIFLFTFGSVAGWCLEVVFRSVCHGGLYIPGFLMGPYCPIYGMGVVMFVFVCNHKNKWRSYIEIVVLSSVLEYVISFLAETMFGQILWDYSDIPFSIGTRVSLIFSLAWGVLGVLLLLAEPVVKRLYERHLQTYRDLSLGIISAICLDFILSAAMAVKHL